MAGSALQPVSEAVFAQLQDATLLALTSGGWHGDLPRAPTYPCGYFELQEREMRGLGTGGLPEIELRTYVLDAAETSATAQQINQRVVMLLKDQALRSMPGYRQAGLVFYDESIPMGDVEVLGQKVKEIVSLFRIYVEEA
jgi:hypothetical protein